LQQRERGVVVDQFGSIAIYGPAAFPAERSILSAMVEEDVRDRIGRGIRLSAEFLDFVDPTAAASEVVVAVGLLGCRYLPWRTKAEFDRDGGSGETGHAGESVIVVPPRLPIKRNSIRSQADSLSAELTALLRREARNA